MQKIFKYILYRYNKLFHNKKKICSPICGHCEVEVSERTARAIAFLIDKRIEFLSNSDKKVLGCELVSQRNAILDGCWHSVYEQLIKEEEEN